MFSASAAGSAPSRREAAYGADPGLMAALDLGTNNCRLLVARRLSEPSASGAPFRVVDAFSRPTRLGEGLAASGRLSVAAMNRTIEALKACADKLQRRGVGRGRYVATEACRRAANCDEFVARVAAETGLALEIISAQEEAGLALAGCAPLLDPGLPRALVFDIGGGSTELMAVTLTASGDARLSAMRSVPVGVVTLGEQAGSDLSRGGGYDAVVAAMAELFGDFERECGLAADAEAGRAQMLGTSGTVTTLGGVHLDLPRYDRNMVDGLTMEVAALRSISRRLAGLDHVGRAAHPCIGQDRADLVLAGCAILDAICQVWPFARLRVADRGVREGVLLSMAKEAVV